jgi:hypothetical protein
MIFGFGGLKLTDDGIVCTKGCLPQQWESLTIKRLGKPGFVIENR